MSRTTANQQTCPRCKSLYLKYNHARNAISRRDNKTAICADCGINEALEDSGLIPSWFDDPKHLPYWDTNSPVWHAQSEKFHDEETGIHKLKAMMEY